MSKRGFTLVEMLVALAVFAVVAVVIQGNLGGVGRSLGKVEARVYARWIAQNHIAEVTIEIERGEPPSRSHQAQLEYADQEWELSSKLEDTTIQHLRKLTVEVCLAEYECHAPVSHFIFIEPRI